ncbi:MAG TPA: HAD-IIB family hydrolase [Vicinamibacterales bacterium]|nr:HAD-IIB family hydrolase [Vicinamibacterales bacterium]
MKVRLIAIDIDGTLLNSRGRIPDENVAAVTAALDAGVHVVLVTGRSFPFARSVAGALPDEVTLIVSNGAIERTRDGRTLARHLLARETARRVLAHTQDFRHASAVLFDREAAGHVVAESMDWDHPHRRGYWERHRHFIGHASPLEAALTEDPIQVMFNGDVATMREVFASLDTLGAVSVCRTEYERQDFSLVDVTAPAATKGQALAARAAGLGLEPGHVMAIGDNLNDLEMLAYAGVPVVMGNAVDALRDRGWRETATHDEAGVAQAIWRLALNGAGR